MKTILLAITADMAHVGDLLILTNSRPAVTAVEPYGQWISLHTAHKTWNVHPTTPINVERTIGAAL